MTRNEFRLDLDRLERLGMVEAIWGENKTFEQIRDILQKFQESFQSALVTRVDSKKASKILDYFKNAQYHEKANCLTLGESLPLNSSLGKVMVVGGGTSDLKVASEAEVSLQFHGVKTELLLDIGVAGLHRLLNHLDRLEKSSIVIACAGMEGSLPTVITGLISQPVIGLPVSVGYGVSKKGKAALNGMLASCSPGLSVVNIDNGYGAAMAALRILKLKI